MTDPRAVDDLRMEVDFLCGLMADGELENWVRVVLRALAAENAELRGRLRVVCQKAVAVVGATGPTSAEDAVDALAAQLAAARADSERLMGVIRGAANAGVQVDEPRLTWVELQMERDDWQALVAAAKGGA